MSELAVGTVIQSSAKGSAARTRKLDTLEKARGEFAKLLRARIAEREQELDALRAELSSIGGDPEARRRQVCSSCGKSGHTKRTCPERGKKKAENSEEAPCASATLRHG